ncbi:hypothetical protein [Variovorax sp. efr-133-TYG-130]|uniref:hypothetical protein n=1 Tax=Variovorax sp. efr-133-TYG-130 TaxID=3040327 RepID=UPI002553BF43|nr:hypothetical protein [Variovorax sp. efr-133-TYG-130]
MRTVMLQNSPGNNGSEVRNGVAYDIEAGDVVVIPAGTAHRLTRLATTSTTSWCASIPTR